MAQADRGLCLLDAFSIIGRGVMQFEQLIITQFFTMPGL
jgi:hypothetical protein